MEKVRFGIPLYSWLIIVCLCFVFVAGATACSNTSVHAQSSGTPLSTAGYNTSLAVTGTAPVVSKVCGTISHLGVGSSGHQTASTGTSTPQSVANCFWQAYYTCSAATLTFVMSSIDTSVIRTFQLQKIGRGCLIQEIVQMRVLPRSPHTTGIYTCAAVKKQLTTLQFLRCQGDGTVTISLLNTH